MNKNAMSSFSVAGHFIWSSVYQAGAYEAEMNALKKGERPVKTPDPKGGVLEAQDNKMGEDLQEIKSDIKLIARLLDER